MSAQQSEAERLRIDYELKYNQEPDYSYTHIAKPTTIRTRVVVIDAVRFCHVLAENPVLDFVELGRDEATLRGSASTIEQALTLLLDAGAIA